MTHHNLKHSLSLLLGLLLTAGLPVSSWADWLGFRNDLKQPVIVRTLAVTENGLRPDGVMILYPGEVRWSLVKDDNARQVLVSDTNRQSRKMLTQKQVPAPSNGDALYGIQSRPGPQGATPTTDIVRMPGQRR